MKNDLFGALFLLAITACSAKENTSKESANTEIAAEAVGLTGKILCLIA